MCLLCNLNSKGNLTSKHLNLELFPEGGGGFQVLFYKFIQIQTTISQLTYEIFQKQNELSTPFLLDLSEKKTKRKQENWEIQKFKIYVKMTSANMTS